MELVKTIDFDEFMTEYYELNKNSNGTNRDVITTEDYEQDKKSGIITRRDFLKYSAIGTTALIIGASTEKAEANPIIWAIIGLASYVWGSDEYIDWHIKVGNSSHTETLYEKGAFELVGEEDFVDGNVYANSRFTIPPRKARIYRNTSLRASVKRDTRAFIDAYFHSSGASKKSSYFTIKS